jgi:hypothetical protein
MRWLAAALHAADERCTLAVLFLLDARPAAAFHASMSCVCVVNEEFHNVRVFAA